MPNTLAIYRDLDKIRLYSGEFTTTIKDSISTISKDGECEGVSHDNNNNCLFVGNTNDRIWQFSGLLTTTMKTSQSVLTVDNIPSDVSYDGAHTPWAGIQADKLYQMSGLFSSTTRDSQSIFSIDQSVQGISAVAGSTVVPWCGAFDDKLYLQSAYSSTVKTSEAIGAKSTLPTGVSWNGTNTPWQSNSNDRFFMTSGQFSSVIKSSLFVSGNFRGIESTDHLIEAVKFSGGSALHLASSLISGRLLATNSNIINGV